MASRLELFNQTILQVDNFWYANFFNKQNNYLISFTKFEGPILLYFSNSNNLSENITSSLFIYYNLIRYDEVY